MNGFVTLRACYCGAELRIRLDPKRRAYLSCPACEYESGCTFSTEREARAWWNSNDRSEPATAEASL